MPAVCLAAMPGRLPLTIELATAIERQRFSGIYVPNVADPLGLCAVLAQATRTIELGTAIVDIYARLPSDYAHTAALVNELSGGRFWFGIGVGHATAHEARGFSPRAPLADVRAFVERLRGGVLPHETLPPVVLAALRQRMVALAAEIGQGVVWAHGARSHMAASLACLRAAQRHDRGFFVGNVALTCIGDDRRAARARLREALSTYATLPNYQRYWIEAGYAEEVGLMRRALAAGDRRSLLAAMSDRWLCDITLSGTAGEVRDGIAAWQANGVRTVVLAPVSVNGGPTQAYREMLAAFSG